MLITRKNASSREDYELSFELWLDEGDTLTDAQATAEGVTVEAVQLFDPLVKVWISGGTPGDSAQVRVTVTSAAGRIKETCFILRIMEC